mmetsp:Transcript_21286/g.46917  ORF Transcript_21286/g.46917 Transcript_21286/m.46917 type:complete len:241 (-) Transcript_21286:112-834(-)
MEFLLHPLKSSPWLPWWQAPQKLIHQQGGDVTDLPDSINLPCSGHKTDTKNGHLHHGSLTKPPAADALQIGWSHLHSANRRKISTPDQHERAYMQLLSTRTPRKAFLLVEQDPRVIHALSFKVVLPRLETLGSLTDELGLGLQDQSLFPTVLILLDLVEASILWERIRHLHGPSFWKGTAQVADRQTHRLQFQEQGLARCQGSNALANLARIYFENLLRASRNFRALESLESFASFPRRN